MKLEHMNTVILGYDRLMELEEFTKQINKSDNIFMQNKSSGGSLEGRPLTIGGQVRLWNSNGNYTDEAMREQWEIADAKIKERLLMGLHEAHALMLKQIQSLWVE